MAVRMRYKVGRNRIIEFPDDETFYFTARDYPDGRVEVFQQRRGSSDSGAVVAKFSLPEIEFIDRGWPIDA